MKVYEYILRIKDQATDRLRRIAVGTNSAMGGIRRFGGDLKRLGGTLLETLGLTSSLARVLGPAALAAGLFFTAKSAVTLAADLEQVQVGFEVMLGSAEKANKMLTELRQFAKVTPFETMDLVRASETMLGFGIAGDKIMPTLRMLGDVSRGNAEKLRLVSLAYSQIQAAGRLMGQDLLQLINAGFNPLQEISAKTGKSMSVLKKEMEDGKISAAMVTAAFKSATSEGGRFFGMMERQSKTFHGMVSTLKDEWAEMLIDVGQRILPKAIRAVQWLRSVLQDLTTRVDFTPLVNTFNQFRQGFNDLIGMFNQLLQTVGITTTQVGSLQFIINAMAFSIRNASIPIKMLILNLRSIIELGGKSAEILSGLGKVVLGFHNFNFAMMAEGATQVKSALTAGFENIRKNVSNFIKQEAEGYREIFNTRPKPAVAQQNNPFGDLGKGVGGVDLKTQEGIDNITGGGKQHVNVTINLENLIGTQNFDVKNIKESVRDMERLVTEALLRVVNSANYAAGQ